MARYKATPQTLSEAGDALLLVTNNLLNLEQQIGDTPRITKPRDLQIATNKMRQMVERMAAEARKLGNTLHDTADIYIRAEKAAFPDAHRGNPGRGAHQNNAALPTIRAPESGGVVFSSAIIAPDWLQVAALKYEADMLNVL